MRSQLHRQCEPKERSHGAHAEKFKGGEVRRTRLSGRATQRDIALNANCDSVRLPKGEDAKRLSAKQARAAGAKRAHRPNIPILDQVTGHAETAASFSSFALHRGQFTSDRGFR
jgi:hypothetical protein